MPAWIWRVTSLGEATGIAHAPTHHPPPAPPPRHSRDPPRIRSDVLGLGPETRDGETHLRSLAGPHGPDQFSEFDGHGRSAKTRKGMVRAGEVFRFASSRWRNRHDVEKQHTRAAHSRPGDRLRFTTPRPAPWRDSHPHDARKLCLRRSLGLWIIPRRRTELPILVY